MTRHTHRRPLPHGRHDTVPPGRAYHCLWTATNLSGTYPLGAAMAGTPRLALRWTHQRAREIAPQLQHPASWLMDGWSRDERERERALTRLSVGVAYQQTFQEDATRYELLVSVVGRGGPL